MGFNQTPKYIQVQGFFCMSILYSIIGFTWEDIANIKWLLIVLYGSTFFFSNYGPNATTFMMPSITFSPSCRSTLNGVCAAFGKAGALVGALLFQPLSDALGDAIVMLICAVTSLVACVVTFFCLSSNITSDSTDNSYESIPEMANVKNKFRKLESNE